MRFHKALALCLFGFLSIGVARAGQTIRWDIVLLNPGTCPIPGGDASAFANDVVLGVCHTGSKITLTGSGTFVVSSSRNDSTHAVTGGGTWTAFDSSGVATGGGTYTVTDLVRWELAPGFLNCPNDQIGGTRVPGLAVFKIEYSDGKEGVLTVSCRLVDTPLSVFEGIAVSREHVAYYHNVEPLPGINTNRTIFHIQKGQEADKD